MISLPIYKYELARLLADGLSIEAAAHRLCIGPKTAKSYLSQIWRAVGFRYEPFADRPYLLKRMFAEGNITKQLACKVGRKKHQVYTGPHLRMSAKAEAEKWNRIFAERFDTPEYYTRGAEIRCQSSLADL